jgi:hypothetical protein
MVLEPWIILHSMRLHPTAVNIDKGSGVVNRKAFWFAIRMPSCALDNREIRE